MSTNLSCLLISNRLKIKVCFSFCACTPFYSNHPVPPCLSNVNILLNQCQCKVTLLTVPCFIFSCQSSKHITFMLLVGIPWYKATFVWFFRMILHQNLHTVCVLSVKNFILFLITPFKYYFCLKALYYFLIRFKI